MLDKRLFDALDGGSQLEIREYAARYPVLLLLDDVGEDTVEEILVIHAALRHPRA